MPQGSLASLCSIGCGAQWQWKVFNWPQLAWVGRGHWCLLYNTSTLSKELKNPLSDDVTMRNEERTAAMCRARVPACFHPLASHILVNRVARYSPHRAAAEVQVCWSNYEELCKSSVQYLVKLIWAAAHYKVAIIGMSWCDQSSAQFDIWDSSSGSWWIGYPTQRAEFSLIGIANSRNQELVLTDPSQ